MTSTNFCTGSFSEKPSSRVLRPPGGGSSDIFGAAEEPAVNSSKLAHHQSASQRDILNQGQKKTDSVSNAGATKAPAVVDTSAIREKHRGTFNPITGEAYASKKDEGNGAGNISNPVSSYSTRPW